MSEHTPGPWRFEAGDPFDHGDDGDQNGFTIFLGDSRLVREQIRYCKDIFPDDGEDYAVGEANARLVSTAPELLSALQTLCSMRNMSSDQLTDAWDKARAAIAKATGKQA